MRHIKTKFIISKIAALIAFVGLLITVSGCSSTYRLSNFSSKKDFYKDFNNFAKNKNVKVTMADDSSFYSNHATEIDNDTLYILKTRFSRQNLTLSTKEIKKIDYLSPDYKSAALILKNGKLLKAENIKVLPDSMSFLGIEAITIKNAVCPVDRLKTISYTNHWLGLLPGVPTGLAAGLLTGYMGLYPVYNNQPIMGTTRQTKEFYLAGSMFVGTCAGTAVGAIAGWLIGFNYTYQFNP